MSSAPRGLDPREGLECWLMKVVLGHWLNHAAGRRQASLGTPVPRTPTVAPGPKVPRTWLSREAKGQVRSTTGPNSLGPHLTRGDRLDVGVSTSARCLGNYLI